MTTWPARAIKNHTQSSSKWRNILAFASAPCATRLRAAGDEEGVDLAGFGYAPAVTLVVGRVVVRLVDVRGGYVAVTAHGPHDLRPLPVAVWSWSSAWSVRGL